MINTVVLVGRITKDLELKSTQSNISFTTGTIAVNRQFRDAKGEREADFLPFIAWRNQAEMVVKYCAKGSLIGVQGRIQTRTYESDGETKYITEIVADSITFLETKKYDDQSDEKKHIDEHVETVDVEEEDLPF